MGRPKKNISEKNIEDFQRDIELAGSRTDLLLRDKKGRSKSCLLCRRRKQRCDHKIPSCTSCLKANVKCIQPARYAEPMNSNNSQSEAASPTESSSRASSSQDITGPVLTSFSNGEDTKLLESLTTSTSPHIIKNDGISKKRKNEDKDQYTTFLEKKLKYLEKLITLPIGGIVFKKRLNHYKKITHLLGDIDDLNENEIPIKNMSNNILPFQFSRSHSNLNSSPEFHKNSNNSSKGDGKTLPALTSDFLDTVDFSKCIFAKYLYPDNFEYDPIFEFNEKLSRSFLDIFFTRLQFKYPLLDEKEIYTFHDIYTKNKIYSCSTNEFHFYTGRMWLIFSISAYLHMTTGKYEGLPPIRYFSTAVRHITKCGDNLTDVQRVELLTLLVLYLLRTDRDSLILYEIIKDIMAIVKDRLHLNTWTAQDSFGDKKLRLFWCVYLLERMICVAVGKPYTIHESEINLPLFNNESFNRSRTSKSSGIHFINQSLKLRRIESNFVEKLNIIPTNKQSTPTKRDGLPMVRRFFEELEFWRSTCSVSDIRNFENETLKLYYYRAVRLLIQPYLEFLTPEDRLFRECRAAAGQICQLYKIFHQKTVKGHSSPAVHTVFGAGVTLIYCMWLVRNSNDQERKKLGDSSKHTRPRVSPSLFSTMDDLRACSVCLYVITERSNFARVFRDTFDQLMNATVGNLIERCGPNSAELIYLNAGSAKTLVKNENKSKEGLNMSRQSSTSISDVNKNLDGPNKDSIDSNGMPPAMARTFGKHQAEEHVGFVEISQVDLEEQKKLRRRQGLLEKATLPKSLAYLLTANESPTKENIIQKNEVESADVLKIKTKQESTENDQTNINLMNKYIVQKPAYPHDFDWKAFQHQAFVQQQLAQQNLQAYLTALNYSKGPVLNGQPISENILGKQQKFPNFQNDVMNVTSTASSIAANPRSNIVSPALSDINSISNPGNMNIKNSLAGSPESNIGLNSVLSSLPNFNEISANNNLLPNSGGVNVGNIDGLKGIPASLFQNPGKSSTGNVLFDNGTHEMINNISNWTNSSIVDSVNVVNYQDQNHIEGVDVTNSMKRGSMLGQPYLNRYQQTGRNDSLGYITSRNSDTGVSISDVHLPGVGNSENQVTNKFNNQPLPNNWNNIVPSSKQAEEFWTINDDYGFLT